MLFGYSATWSQSGPLGSYPGKLTVDQSKNTCKETRWVSEHHNLSCSNRYWNLCLHYGCTHRRVLFIDPQKKHILGHIYIISGLAAKEMRQSPSKPMPSFSHLQSLCFWVQQSTLASQMETSGMAEVSRALALIRQLLCKTSWWLCQWNLIFVFAIFPVEERALIHGWMMTEHHP